MDENWYVIQVRTGKEEQMAMLFKRHISSDILIDCFIPRYKRMKKYKGQWHNDEYLLLKGYVFVITDHIDDLYNALKEIPDLTKVLGNDGTQIYPLWHQEVIYLLKFGDQHVLDSSIGYIEGDNITIISGPLIGHEGLIKKIDRHKRIAYLEMQLFDQLTTIQVGLEIIQKK